MKQEVFSTNTGDQYQQNWHWNKPTKKTAATRKDNLDVFTGESMLGKIK
jgi:hypothetical protein